MDWDYGAKRQYRRQVWNEFAARVKRAGGRPSETYGLLMPGADGDEIEVAMQKGFRQEHLCVVDRDPAVLLGVRARFPHVLPFSGELETAFRRAADLGIPLVVANLDTCANISQPLLQTLRGIGQVWRPQVGDLAYGVLAVTVLRGRERPPIMAAMDNTVAQLRSTQWEKIRSEKVFALRNERDLARLFLLWRALEVGGQDRYEVATVRSGIYQSIAGHQTLLWSVHEMLDAAANHAGYAEFRVRTDGSVEVSET